MSTPVGIIKNFVETLMTTKKTGSAAVDEALKSVGAKNLSTLKSKFNSALDKASSAKDFLEKNCGVRITNEDTGAITGSDAGGSTTKTAESIVPETATAKSLTSAEYKSFTKNGLKVNITYDTDEDDDSSFKKKQRYIASTLYNWWIPESLDLINQSLGLNFTDDRANINTININIGGADEEYGVSTKFKYDMGLASSVNINISPDIVYDITLNDKNGQFAKNKNVGAFIQSDLYDSESSAYFTNYLDRLILQVMAEVALKANVPYVQNMPTEIRTGLVEIVGGYDDASSYVYDFVEEDTDAIGYTLMRYLAKNYSDGKPSDKIYIHNNDTETGNTGADTFIVTANTKAATINTGGGNDTIQAFGGDGVVVNGTSAGEKITVTKSSIKGSGVIATVNGGRGKDTFVGSSGNDKLNGEAGDDLIKGGKGNDTLSGGADDDTLTGGDGKDTFIYGTGNDIITDYAVGKDKIKISSAISKTSVNGSDVVFTIGKGSLTVQNVAGKSLTIVDSAGKEYATVVSGETKLTVTNKTSSPVTAGDSIKVIDASKRTTAVEITGNKNPNTISGGSNNDTIHGAAGNDSIVGNKGDDKIFGDAGNDKIYGDDGADTLSGGKNNDYLLGDAGNDSLSGDAGNDTLSGGKGNDKLLGGAGNDSLSGGTGNDTLTGGKGNDIFFYTGGKDTITDYDTGDKIALSSEISKSKVSGSNVVFTIGDGTLTVKNGKGKTLNMIDADGESFVTVVGGTTLNVTNDISSPVTAGDDIKVINASKRTTAVEITGNDLANTINGGSKNDTIYGAGGNDYLLGNAGNDNIYGGDGDDNIWGGKGNDELWGDDGADTFVYMNGDGKDIIYGFDDDDLLQIMDDFTPSYKNGTVTLTVGSGSITLKDFTATTFHINDETYKISGKKFVAKS